VCIRIVTSTYVVAEAGCNWYLLDINIYSLSKKNLLQDELHYVWFFNVSWQKRCGLTSQGVLTNLLRQVLVDSETILQLYQVKGLA
jgi:hypothetical protein